MANKRISELGTSGALSGTELVEVVQGGASVKTTTQDIADLGGGGGTWGSITGTLSSQADLQSALDSKLSESDLTASRTLTSAGALIQADNLNIVYANSGTPFNITVDLLSVGTQITVINIGAATATLIEGSGVTLPGTTVDLATGENAIIIYRVAATPEVYTGSASGGTVTSVSSANADITVATGTTTPVLTMVQAPALRSATTTVSVSAATAPTSGQVLTATSGTAATWQTPSAGFSDPMTTRGDIIVRNASNTTARLAVGTNGQILRSDGTDISWTTPPYYLLASGGTLTGVNTFTSNAANQQIDAGTWTATANNQYHRRIGATITGRGTTSDYYAGLEIDNALGAGANTQALNQFHIKGTFATNGFSGVLQNYMLVRTAAGSNDVFFIREGQMKIGQTASTQNITFTASGSDNTIAATGGNDLKLTHTSLIAMTVNSQDMFYLRTPTTYGAQLLQGVTTATTSAATQRNSIPINLTSKMWNGSSSYDDFFTFRNTASTATQGEQYLDIFYGQSSSVPSFANLGFRMKNNGDIIVGSGTSTTATPSARFHITGSGTTTDAGLLVEASDGTDRFRVQSDGAVSTTVSALTNTNAVQVAGATTRKTFEMLWVDVATNSGNTDVNIFNGYTDAIAQIEFTVTAVKTSDGVEAYSAKKIASFHKDGSADATLVGSVTIVHEVENAATNVPNLTLSMNGANVRAAYDLGGGVDTYRWTIWAKVTITQL